MEKTKERSTLTIEEKERRWSLIRNMLKAQNLAAAIVVRGYDFSAAARYITHMVVMQASMHIVIFPAEGAPILVTSNPVDVNQDNSNSWIGEEHIYFSRDLGNELASHIARLKLENEKIGIDNLGVLTAQEYLVFKEKCPHVELVDVTADMAKIRGPKSKEEIVLIEDAIDLGASLQKVFTDNLKPGMTEQAVVGKVMDMAKAHGVESALWLTITNEETVYPYMAGENIIRRELPVTFSTEFEIMGGYSCQIARMYCWEKPNDLYRNMLDVREGLRHLIVEELRPGRALADFAARLEAVVDKAGFECDFIGHAAGLHPGEFPYISSSPGKGRFTEWIVSSDEVYVVHPQIRQKGAKGPLVFIGDMYFVGEEGTRWMTPMLPGLPERME